MVRPRLSGVVKRSGRIAADESSKMRRAEADVGIADALVTRDLQHGQVWLHGQGAFSLFCPGCSAACSLVVQQSDAVVCASTPSICTSAGPEQQSVGVAAWAVCHTGARNTPTAKISVARTCQRVVPVVTGMK